MSGARPSGTGSRADASSPQAVSTKGFDPARKERHRAKMQRKALERSARVRGFTPMPNRRIAARHALQVMTLVQLGVAPIDAERRAWRDIAKTLPAPPMVRDYSRKPSKNNDPTYRKSIWPLAKAREQ